jgi:hypothetical protein
MVRLVAPDDPRPAPPAVTANVQYVASFVFRGHAAAVQGLAFGPKGAWLASAAQDNSVRIWDPTRDPRGRSLQSNAQVSAVTFDALTTGLDVRALDRNGEVRAWSVADGRAVGRPVRLPAPAPLPPAVFVGGRQVVGVAKEDPGAIVRWHADTGRPVDTPPPGAQPILALAADATGRYLAWATDRTIHWRDLDGPTTVGSARLDAPPVAVAMAPGGGWVVAVTSAGQPGTDDTAWVIDATDREPPRAVARGPRMTGGLAFSADGHELAIAVGDAVRVCRAGAWDLWHQVPCPPPTTGLAYSPDGRRLAAVNADGVLTLTDPAANHAVFQLHSLNAARPTDRASNARVAFSPDGHWLASTNWDGTLNLWNGSPTGAD